MVRPAPLEIPELLAPPARPAIRAQLAPLVQLAHKATLDPRDRKVCKASRAFKVKPDLLVLRVPLVILARLDLLARLVLKAILDLLAPPARPGRRAMSDPPARKEFKAMSARPDLRAHRAILQRFPALPDPPAQLDRPAPKGQDRAMSLVRFPPLTTLSFGGMALRAN